MKGVNPRGNRDPRHPDDPKRPVRWTLHPRLFEQIKERAEREQRSINSLVEQALAEFMHVPLAFPELPEQPVELCPQCEQAVLHHRRCNRCGWHRDPRPWKIGRRAQERAEREAKRKKRRTS